MTRTVSANRKLSPPQARGWLCLALSAVMLLPLLAAPALAQAPEGAAGSALAAAGAAAPKRFSLDFVATDLVDVIKALAAQSGANIAVSSKVSGTVTLRLTDVTVEEALTVISKINGLEFAQVDSTYVIGTPEEVKTLVAVPAAPDVPQTRVIALKFLQPDDAAALLMEAEPQLKCSVSPTGGLIVNAVPAVLDRAAALITGVDVAPAVGVAKHAIYTVKYADPMEMMETLKAVFPDMTCTAAPRSATPIVTPGTGGMVEGGLAALAAPQLSAQGQQGGAYAGGASGGTSGSQRNELSPVTQIVLSGAPGTVERALDLCKQLDVAPRQVKISSTITEVRTDRQSRLGIDWNSLAGKVGVTVGEDSAATGLRDLKVGKILRSPVQISGAINALVSERIMANPSITILDGRQATIHAGDKIYYPQVIGYTPLGGQIVQATEINVGVTLMVNPRIGPDGDVTLTLVPTVSSITESVFAGYPTITERSTVTTVRVKSGETVAIGGLMRDDDAVTINKVPLLGDIPILGDLLFKSKVKHPQRSEVVIIITPEIVEAAMAG
jgi:type II secretory pathway component GspD/PulD (secretin)